MDSRTLIFLAGILVSAFISENEAVISYGLGNQPKPKPTRKTLKAARGVYKDEVLDEI